MHLLWRERFKVQGGRSRHALLEVLPHAHQVPILQTGKLILFSPIANYLRYWASRFFLGKKKILKVINLTPRQAPN